LPKTPPTPRYARAALAGELDPERAAVVEDRLGGALDLREQQVDRIVGVQELEAAACERALADLLARVVGDQRAVIHSAPDLGGRARP
jgi:hypothetical protein